MKGNEKKKKESWRWKEALRGPFPGSLSIPPSKKEKKVDDDGGRERESVEWHRFAGRRERWLFISFSIQRRSTSSTLVLIVKRDKRREFRETQGMCRVARH